jgi:hypothetical protein
MIEHESRVNLTDTAFYCGCGQLEDEIQRRLALPLDAWEPISTEKSLTSRARAYLARLAESGNAATA